MSFYIQKFQEKYFRSPRFIYENEKPEAKEAPKEAPKEKATGDKVQIKINEYDKKRTDTLTTLGKVITSEDQHPETKTLAISAKNEIEQKTVDAGILRVMKDLTEEDVKGYINKIQSILEAHSKKEAPAKAPDKPQPVEKPPSKPPTGPEQKEKPSGPAETIKMKIFDKNIDIVSPAGTKIDKSTIDVCLKRIEKRTDLKPFITNTTKFEASSDGRLTFTVNNGKENVKYIASQYDVLKIIKDNDPQWKEKTAKLNIEEKKLAKQLEAEVKADSTLTAEQKDIINKFVEGFGGNYGALMVFDMMNKDKNYSFKISEKYKTVIDQLNVISETKSKLTTRKLIDDDPAKASQGKPQEIQEVPDESSTERFDHYYENGPTKTFDKGKINIETSYDEKTKTSKLTTYNENGKITDVTERDDKGEILKSTHFDEQGKEISRTVRDKDGKYHQEMIDEQGKSFSTFDQEKAKSPEMTKEKYFDLLAKKLNTPEKIAVFFETFLQYTKDEPGNDYWQTSGETISRIDKGKMLGDCDDYAALAKEILIRQGKNAQVLGIPGHAICIWAEKRPNGRYDAYSLCTFGLDKNGNRQGKEPDPEKEKGYTTLKDAINSLMGKYKEEGVGVEKGIEYKVSDKMGIDDIPEMGKKQSLDAPLEILTDPKLAQQFKQLQLAVAKEDYAGAEKIYAMWAVQYPGKKFVNDGLANLYQIQIDKILAAKGKNKITIDKTTVDSEPQLQQLLKKLITQREISIDSSTSTTIFLTLDHYYKISGDKQKAVSIMEKAVQFNPSDASLNAFLISDYADIGNSVQMEKTYARMRVNCPIIDAGSLRIVSYSFTHVGNTKKADEIMKEAEGQKEKEDKKSS